MPNLRETKISPLYMLMIRASSTMKNWSFFTISTLQKALTWGPHWNYEAFWTLNMFDDECQAEFHFYKTDVYDLMKVLGFPEKFTCHNGLTHGRWHRGSLHRFKNIIAYPCCYLDMIVRFARPVLQLCMTTNMVMDYLYTHWSHLLTLLNQPWLSPDNLLTFTPDL